VARPLALVLASSSPQRRAILERLGVPFTLRPVEVAELDHGEPAEVAAENALRKARAASTGGDAQETVLGVDTLVALDRRIYGKPPDEHGAAETLRALSGATHTVFSGVALLDGGGERLAVARTQVSFRELRDDLIERYLASGEWRGRAGGYAIQGLGAVFVREIHGDYENVVGLPLATLLDMLPEML
jgi:septum formation protein